MGWQKPSALLLPTLQILCSGNVLWFAWNRLGFDPENLTSWAPFPDSLEQILILLICHVYLVYSTYQAPAVY